MYTGHYNILSMYVCMYVYTCTRQDIVYTFTELHDSVHEYGGSKKIHC